MKLALVTINLLAFFMGNVIHTPITIPENHGIYPTTMIITDTIIYDMGTESLEDDEGEIIMIDANGNEWVMYEYPEDYMVGDFVAVIMDDNGTPNSIYDDIILDMRYSGYSDEY